MEIRKFAQDKIGAQVQNKPQSTGQVVTLNKLISNSKGYLILNF